MSFLKSPSENDETECSNGTRPLASTPLLVYCSLKPQKSKWPLSKRFSLPKFCKYFSSLFKIEGQTIPKSLIKTLPAIKRLSPLWRKSCRNDLSKINSLVIWTLRDVTSFSVETESKDSETPVPYYQSSVHTFRYRVAPKSWHLDRTSYCHIILSKTHMTACCWTSCAQKWWTENRWGERNDGHIEMRRRAGRKRGSVGGRAGRKEKDGGDIRRMTEELWKWYDRFTKRLHILILVKHFIEIPSGMFKKVTAVDSQ